MGAKSNIEWTDATWNPVTGCTRVSPGCANCYAEALAERFRGTKAYPNGFDIMIRYEKFHLPLRWKKPRRIFVNSMSDMFHSSVSFSDISAICSTMLLASHHRYMVLTKRPTGMRFVLQSLRIGNDFKSPVLANHIFWGVSVENRKHGLPRISELQNIDTPNRFLSIEPLLEDLGPLDLTGISWVIVGGESGPGARPMQPDWVRSIRDQCLEQKVPFFFKQWGGVRKKGFGRVLDGRLWDEMPDGLKLNL